MPGLDRRSFIKASGTTLGCAALGSIFGCRAGSDRRSQWNGFKYAMCNESMAELGWAEQCRIIGHAGYKGIEIAAFTLVKKGVNEISQAERQEMVSVMQNADLECVGLHWLLAPPPKGLHFTVPDVAVRGRTIAYFHELIDFCGDLGGSYMIFGSPKQRNAMGVTVEEAGRNFAEGLESVTGHAQRRGVKILIEPLGRRMTDVINTMAEAAELVQRVDHPAVQGMFDFNNTPNETEPFDVLIRKHYERICHVHVQEQGGRHLGTGTAANDYVKAFQTLKDLRYDKWISLEVFDFSPGGKAIAEESMMVLKEIESKLV